MRLFYHLVLIPISLLPKTLRYGLANTLAWLLFRVFRYRRTVVDEGLKIAFPQFDQNTLKSISASAYRNLADIIMEAIRGFSIKRSEAEAGLLIHDTELLDRLFKEGKDIIMTGGHYANWEAICWGGHRFPHETYALYKPLRNAYMDLKVRASRSQFGVNMISIKAFEEYMSEAHSTPRMFIFGIDQRPRRSCQDHICFLGRKTAVFTGTERMSKKYNMAVVAGRLKRVSRGQYEVGFELLFDSDERTEEMEITQTTMTDIESLIIDNPADWLWTHDRWKFTPFESC